VWIPSVGPVILQNTFKKVSSRLLSGNIKIRICKVITLPVVLYGCETLSLALREELRLRVLSRIFGTKREEVTGGWGKLHNEKLHNLYSSQSIIRLMKPRRMRWAGHAARMGRRGMHIGYWWENQKERAHQENQDVGGWTILKYILERQDGMLWTGSIWFRIGTSGGLL
jgi:hypothetical protein